jgi:peptidoglycan/xylan/chitin deacetylase (PgdA/CDA1 family)
MGQLVGVLTGMRAQPLILGYHRVVEHFDTHADLTIRPMLISRAMLEKHLDWIGGRYRFASLDELGRRLEEGASAEGLAAVTFDDGYSDVYENAFPLLQRKGIPAAVFVVTDIVGSRVAPFHDRLYLLVAGALKRWRANPEAAEKLFSELGLAHLNGAVTRNDDPLSVMGVLLDRLSQEQAFTVAEALCGEVELSGDELRAMRPLTWEMLREMQRSDITIGSHTRSHPLLTNETGRKLDDELKASRAALERELNTPIRHFAYPDGRWSTLVVDSVKSAGYRFAYTTCSHRDPRHPLLTIPRLVLWERSCADSAGRFSASVMSCHADGLFRLVARCKTNHRRRPLSRAA